MNETTADALVIGNFMLPRVVEDPYIELNSLMMISLMPAKSVGQAEITVECSCDENTGIRYVHCIYETVPVRVEFQYDSANIENIMYTYNKENGEEHSYDLSNSVVVSDLWENIASYWNADYATSDFVKEMLNGIFITCSVQNADQVVFIEGKSL